MKSSSVWGRLSRNWVYPCVAVAYIAAASLLMSSRCFAVDTQCLPIEGSSSLLKHDTLILIGEMHGTVQIPRFAGDLVCAALDQGFRVNLGLEIPSDERAKLARFLSSDGRHAAHVALFENSTFWRGSMQDGRRSEAMFDLIDRVRMMLKARRGIALVPIDRADSEKNIRRDEAMARNIREIAAKSDGAVTIVLTGNVHSRLTSDPEHPEWGTPMGAYLRDLKPASLAPSYLAGSTWACMPTCDTQALKATSEVVAPWAIKHRQDEAANYVFGVGALTPSPPAYQRLDTSKIGQPAQSN